LISTLGLWQYQSGKHSQARATLEKLVESNPEEELFLNHLSSIYYALNQPDEAIRNLKKSIELNPTLPDTYLLLSYSIDLFR
jgi:tetratricopeptide (TPR) repeat protein